MTKEDRDARTAVKAQANLANQKAEAKRARWVKAVASGRIKIVQKDGFQFSHQQSGKE